jgi:hypothetical protein
MQGRDGNFYGTTMYGGAFYQGTAKGHAHLWDDTFGTIFQLTPDGTLTTLISFTGTNGSHPYPNAGLIEGRNYFYGIWVSSFLKPGMGISAASANSTIREAMSGSPNSFSRSISSAMRRRKVKTGLLTRSWADWWPSGQSPGRGSSLPR